MNPSKQTQAFFSAEKGDALEVRVAAQDQRTKSGLIWANDTGSADTGENRVGAAYQHNNLFDKDHTLTLSFATSPLQAKDVQQYSVSYQVPFYAAGGMASAYAIRSDVNTGQVANFFDVSGRGDFLGGDYTYALPPAGRYKQFLIIGVDDKLFDNDIDFEGQPIGVDVRSRPISVRHNGNWRSEKFSGSTYAGIFVNIESGSHNDDVSYSLTRAGATPSWSAFRAGARLRYEISTWSLIGRVDAQYTDEPLIPGEQFGVGGLYSLRGIDQRQITGDRGFFLSGEVMSPVIGNAGPRLLVFVDVGRVSRIDALPGEVSRDTVASIGAGLRWGWKNRLNVTVDYGYVVDGGDPLSVNPIEEGDSRFHFQVLARI